MTTINCTNETRPKPSKEYLERIHAIKDEDIDFSDIPDLTTIEGLTLRPRQDMYKPIKGLDKFADVIA